MATHCDYLIIGGGSSGAVVARRLAERTSGRIILVEAGKSDEGDPAAVDLTRLDEQTADYDWGFRAAPLAGSPPVLNYARAKLLGGCANHNDCAFIRPPDSDFDEWERLGATGWNAAAMAQYWQRITETIAIETAPCHPASRRFIEAGLELGLEEVDFGREVRPGVGLFPLNAKGRLRQSSSVAYLHPIAALPKHLEVRTRCMANRLIIENGRAAGAETSRGEIRAARAVVLAAGSIQTPQLMMLSGLGPAAQLKDHGIAVIRDMPHLGRHLRDHVAAPVVWETHEQVSGWEICPFEATMMLQLERRAPAPDILFHFGLRVREKYDDARLATKGPAVKASPNVTRAKSEGSVRLSGPAMTDKPEIALNYFDDPSDLGLLAEALKFTRRLGQTKAMQALCRAEVHPGPSVQTDDDWRAYIRSVCETVYHPCCTAAIGRVVTPELKVMGVDGLFIADASVFASLVTVNINAAVMMVAEKAADCILGS
ncbi:MAG: GMC family oxidoreductase N-terminal domain-containing protein [Aestuariivirga sp.]|uniref:GMC family oxidoreductase n=1 Tax=Aestuariivirga sp. TaxID=2650926 RepID=UPI0025C46E30|nr:GMC oxidoreductase [Aestuariivirga sp.]MCA3559955.1 GMC family oxidoreductase N-terminal domain-containing protein [Aestuariivirga sp.]